MFGINTQRILRGQLETDVRCLLILVIVLESYKNNIHLDFRCVEGRGGSVVVCLNYMDELSYILSCIFIDMNI